MMNHEKLLSHLLLVSLLIGVIPIALHVGSENASAVPDTHTWDGGGADVFAGTHANWVSNIAPIAGDSVVFDAGALPCTWNLSIAVNSWSMNVGYSGVITQGASFSVTSYSQAAGTYTGSGSYILTDSGSWTKTGGL
jgi:hypothetical protein